MSTQKKALAGLATVLMLATAGCGEEKPENPLEGQSSAPSSASSAPSEAAPSESDESESAEGESSESASEEESESEAPREEYEPVTSDAPQSEKEGREKATEAVELYYEVNNELMRERGERVDELAPVVARDQELRDMRAGFKDMQETRADDVYEGESVAHPEKAIAGPQRGKDGEWLDYTSVEVQVCEDNTDVTITGKDGEEKQGGAPRYQISYIVLWDQESGQWKVALREVMTGEDGKAKSC